jgi:hypothetical protein
LCFVNYSSVLAKIGYNIGTITAVNSALIAIATDANAPIFGCSATAAAVPIA